MIPKLLLAAAMLAGLAACDLRPATRPDAGPTESRSAVAPPTPQPETPMAANPTTNPADKVQHTDEEWKKLLTPEQYQVLREKGTDRAFTGPLTDTIDAGTYSCAACGLELFTSDTKFHSGCGWPSFYAAKAGDRVTLHHDTTYGMTRTEVLCSRCGSHLGHVFDDAPDQPTGQRFCINSTSLKFVPKAATTQPSGKPAK